MRHALVALLLFAAGALAYANSLTNPFVFDDLPAIVGNRDIRQIWPPIWLDSSWHGSLASRPVVMCSLALSYAIDGANPITFRFANLLMHIGCSLLFYAIAHRLFHSTPLRSTYGNAGQALPLICALVWLLHPIQSQCINYAIQRSEILMAFCALTVFYAAQRSIAGTGWWSVLAVAACFLGMASKESMVAVPLLVPLCDRAMSGDHMIWRQRLVFYLSLAASWLLLFWLLSDQPHRTTIGFEHGVSAWNYAINQCQVIIGYLRLSFWPTPLIFDYGYPVADLTLSAVWPQALALLLLLAGSAWLLYRHPAAGFAAAAFFALLAPTSSFVPLVNEVAAERRMYLPLAALIGLTCCALYNLCAYRREYLRIAMGSALCAALALGVATTERNRTYKSTVSIWSSAVAAVPDNPRAHVNLALELAAAGDLDKAQLHYLQTLELAPRHAVAHNNLALVLDKLGDRDRAIAHYQQAIELRTGFFEAHNNLGIALAQQLRWREAIDHYRRALHFKSDYAKAHNNLGIALLQIGQQDEAVSHFQQAVTIAPDYAGPHGQLGFILEQRDDLSGALYHYYRAAELEPNNPSAHNNLGIALEMNGERHKAIEHYRRAITIAPNDFHAHYNLGLAQWSLGHVEEAIALFQQAITIDPNSIVARQNLAAARAAAQEP